MCWNVKNLSTKNEIDSKYTVFETFLGYSGH